MKHKQINLYTYPVQFSIEEADYSQTYLAQMYPLVEASGVQEQYYVSHMSGQLDIWKNAIEQAPNSQMYPHPQ